MLTEYDPPHLSASASGGVFFWKNLIHFIPHYLRIVNHVRGPCLLQRHEAIRHTGLYRDSAYFCVFNLPRFNHVFTSLIFGAYIIMSKQLSTIFNRLNRANPIEICPVFIFQVNVALYPPEIAL